MAKSSAQISAPSFGSVLDRPSNEIDRVIKPVPQGSYVAMVQGQARMDKSSKKQTEFAEYTLKLVEALDDVDEKALDEYLTKLDGTKKALADCTIKATFYYGTDGGMARLASFLDHLDGLSPDEAEAVEESTSQRMAEAAGKSCVIHVKHEPWQSGEGVSARVDSTSAVES